MCIHTVPDIPSPQTSTLCNKTTGCWHVANELRAGATLLNDEWEDLTLVSSPDSDDAIETPERKRGSDLDRSHVSLSTSHVLRLTRSRLHPDLDIPVLRLLDPGKEAARGAGGEPPGYHRAREVKLLEGGRQPPPEVAKLRRPARKQ